MPGGPPPPTIAPPAPTAGPFNHSPRTACRQFCYHQLPVHKRGSGLKLWNAAIRGGCDYNRDDCLRHCAQQKAVLLHPQKTGGGSAEALFLSPCRPYIRLVDDHVATVTQALAGHFGPGRPIIVLRDPADRLVSEYYMHQNADANCPALNRTARSAGRNCNDNFVRVAAREWTVADMDRLLSSAAHGIHSLSYYFGASALKDAYKYTRTAPCCR